ncbi:MAG TPA: zinc-binding dehydrogenase [Gaiellaceae bacterium]
MKAVVHDRYGPPAVLRVDDVEPPVPQNGLTRLGGRRLVFTLPRWSQRDVVYLKELIEAGAYRAVIDRVYRLDEIADAARYVETGQKTGNVVLTVA